MRKLISFMHVSLDGFVAGPNGEMDWILVDDELFEEASEITQACDTALYGRVTYQMMDAYWPTAATQPNASKHDLEHSSWYNAVDKIVLSKSFEGRSIPLVTVVSKNPGARVKEIKAKPGKQIVIFGSPGAVHSLMKEDLVDEFRLFVNPVLLGKGIPMFDGIDHARKLKLISEKRYASGVMGLHYQFL